VYVAFDVLYRLLRQLQYEVQYVRNFTDVDDKIIKRASECGEEPLALAGRFITEFHEDMAALGCLPPTVSRALTEPSGGCAANNRAALSGLCWTVAALTIAPAAGLN
jgi:cysteinyl-tRNA synthetase